MEPAMPSTIFTAKEYDPAKEKRRNRAIIAIVVVIIVAAALVWWFRNWPEEHVANQFVAALQAQDYPKAYGVWMHDPEWKSHPQKYERYPFADFYRDWGPSGEWGLIKTFNLDGSVNPPHASGVIVQFTINGRAEKLRLWVEKKDKTITFCQAQGC